MENVLAGGTRPETTHDSQAAAGWNRSNDCHAPASLEEPKYEHLLKRLVPVDQSSVEQSDTAVDRMPETNSHSRRQREGTDNVGAFGRREGSSDLVFFAGVLPVADGEVVDASTARQTSACLDVLETRLAERGLDISAVVKLDVQLTGAADGDAFQTVYAERVDDCPPRTTTVVSALPGGADVQLDVVAAAE